MGAAELLPGEGTLDPVVGRLEDFFGSPEFTSSVGAFLSAHAPAVGTSFPQINEVSDLQ